MNTIWKMISIASFGLLVWQVFFQKNKVETEVVQTIEVKKNKAYVFISEEMPRFPGCENWWFSKQERQSCADKKMLEFIYSNIKFPKINGCVESVSVAQFTILKDGSLADIKILKSLSPKFDDEILKMLEKMPKWIPGKQNGKAVNVRYNLPVKFRLQ